VVRTWPWVIVAIVALALYPDLEDKELGYPMLMLDFLPAGLLGLVVASLVAAFMSTMSTLINWSASYMTNDLYARFIRPQAQGPELVMAARIASVLVTIIAGFAAFQSESIGTVYRLILALGTGPGLVLILRWYWWRINAWAELAAMLAGFIIGALTSLDRDWNPLTVDDFGMRLMITAGITMLIWVPVMLLTRSEPDEKLDAFYIRVRPGGPGWRRQRERTGVQPAQDLGKDLLRVLAGLAFLFGTMFAIGALLLLRWGTLGMMSILALVGIFALRRLGRSEIAPAMPEPPTHPV
jgi:Na+/proline symporter